MKRLSILILCALCALSMPAAADPLLFWSGGFGGGNDVLPQIIKRPVNGGCTNGCSTTKPTGGVR